MIEKESACQRMRKNNKIKIATYEAIEKFDSEFLFILFIYYYLICFCCCVVVVVYKIVTFHKKGRKKRKESKTLSMNECAFHTA